MENSLYETLKATLMNNLHRKIKASGSPLLHVKLAPRNEMKNSLRFLVSGESVKKFVRKHHYMQKSVMLLILCSLVFISCSERSRDNPFDPNNPVTRGAPTGFRITSNRHTVTLEWNPIDVSELTSYKLHRGINDSTLNELVEVDSKTTLYYDSNLIYDNTYYYSIQGITEFDDGNLSLIEKIIPGNYNIWIADYWNGTVWRISYDGAHSIGSLYNISPKEIVYNPKTKSIWIADYWSRNVIEISPEFSQIREILLPDMPIDMAIDTTGGIIYTLLWKNRIIQTYSIEGVYKNSVTIPFSISKNSSIVYDEKCSTLWLSEPVNSVLMRISSDLDSNSIAQYTQFDNPRKMEPDPINGGTWIASNSGIIHFNSDSVITLYKTDYSIMDISVHPGNGDCYYIGRRKTDNNWIVGKIAIIPVVQDSIIFNNSYPNVYSIQVIPGSTGTGFILSQAGTGKLLRFDHLGRLIGEMSYFDWDLDFALE
ncbi:MAG: hypothetical protein IIB95_12385 [Candidatus Marinimicrobia bacterium]|nr:hypothetical protein [Candidatus Neomarinimicrobiota bacterium]